MAQASILAVDHNARNIDLLAQFLGKEGYCILSASSLAAFDKMLADGFPIDLALVDISGFDPSIWPRCQRLHDMGIPVLVLSPKQSLTIQQEGLSHGASGVLVKPLIAKELLSIVQNLLDQV